MALFILAIGLINFLLGLFVLVKKKKEGLFFAALSFFSSIWCFNNFMTGIAPAEFWLRGAYAWGSLVVASGLVWVLWLTKEKRLLIKGLIIYLTSTFFFFTIYLSQLIINRVDQVYLGRFDGSTGILFPYYSLILVGFTISMLVKLVIAYKNSSGIRKYQFLFVLIGAIFYAGISLTGSFILPLFSINQFMYLDSLSSVAYLITITYAITRYRLMDIRLLLKKSTIFSLLVVVISIILVFVSNILSYVFEDWLGTRSVYLASFIAAVFIAIIFQPLRSILEGITNRFLFSKSYDPAVLLADISKLSSSTIDLKKMLLAISQELNDSLHCDRLAFALINNQLKLELAYQENFDLIKIKEFIKGKEKTLPLYFSQSYAIQSIDELKTEYEAGEYQPKSVELLYALHELGISLVVPLHDQKSILGVICIGRRKSGDTYNTNDIKIIEVIANQISLAIKNAYLYQEVSSFAKVLETKVAEQTKDIRKANTQLQKANKDVQAKNVHLEKLLQMRTEFLDIASHQLKTPVSVIRGTLSMFEDGSLDKVDEAQKKKFISNMARKADKLNTIISDILRASEMDTDEFKIDYGAAKPVQLEDILKDVCDDALSSVEDRKIKLELSLPPDKTSPLLTESDFINQAIFNLVDNAVKYTKKGSVKVALRQEKDNLIITVADTGIGIPKDEQKKLFDKFTRATNAVNMYTDGSGLGLFIVKKIIEAHQGGQITFKSEENKGTEFTIVLKAIKEQKNEEKNK